MNKKIEQKIKNVENEIYENEKSIADIAHQLSETDDTERKNKLGAELTVCQKQHDILTRRLKDIEYAVQFGSNLRRIRNEKQKKQADLAEACGVSITAIQAYERGDYVPKPDIKLLLASKLGVSVIDLMPEGINSTEDLVLAVTEEHNERTEQRNQLLKDFDSVNRDGKEAISSHAAYIASLQKYQKEKPEPDEIIGGWDVPPFENK